MFWFTIALPCFAAPSLAPRLIRARRSHEDGRDSSAIRLAINQRGPSAIGWASVCRHLRVIAREVLRGEAA
jgi:hypothetical protein